MHPSVLPIPAVSTPGRQQRWSGLPGAARTLALSDSARAHTGLTLVIAASPKHAVRIEDELRFFCARANTSSADDNSADVLPILHFPDWETLPYDIFSPHQDIVSERLRTLYQLPGLQQGLLVVPATTLMHRLPPAEFIAAHSFVHRVGERVNIDSLRRQLNEAGYRCVDTVYEHGEYAVRGALVDIYPMGSDTPFRIDLFDDEIDSLRSFDPHSQLTIDKHDAITLLPAREFPLEKDAVKHFLDSWHAQFDVDPRHCAIYQDIRDSHPSPGIEYYLPLFFPHTATLFDYLPHNTQVFIDGDVVTATENFWNECNERYRNYGVDPTRPLLAPTQVFIPVPDVFAALNKWPQTFLHQEPLSAGTEHHNFNCNSLPDIRVDSRAAHPLARLETALQNFNGRALFCAESPGRREALLALLASVAIRPQEVATWQEFVHSDLALGITLHPLEQGTAITTPALWVISESELFGEQVLQRRRRVRAQDGSEQWIKNLGELQIGAPVVHIDHGVGRYQGLQTLAVNNETQEFLMLGYADAAKLYVPVADLHLISRYSGGDEALAPLHRLGNEQWQKSKDKAAQKIRDTAVELLDIYARRAARVGFTYKNPEDYRAFSAEFPFEETPDQSDAIAAVLRDMISPQPMDRLVCGDVGFGKTEVAMRAAFIAISSNRQVVILVPTTLLAQQHFENFRDRFANWPVSVEALSRFRSAKQQADILARVAQGKVDILIGTHKLLNSSVSYHDLGLLVIDEEHRFGVHQKEKLKALRAEVDILTLTATPIPRTLNLAMGGLRDLSIIATPPARRLSVKTFVRQHDAQVIREAILREILRGGQVYYLHNDVKSIDRAARELKELLPEARVDIAHGQMRERDLEKVMSDFYHQRFNVLVCSTIIETGIDIPSANTIVIHRADKLGLAQLHQLRGRVGRSHHQAYAYLLVPAPQQMSDDAHKRLEAITFADHLGSGFTLATQDMEIRGAGELLGDDQSGHIHSIGFSLYMELLDKAVNAIRAGKAFDVDSALHHATEINLNIPALIPDTYLADINARLLLYKRIASTQNNEQLRELQVEMIDRFGLLPEALKNLIQVTTLRHQAERLGIARLDANAQGGKVTFSRDTLVAPITIVQMVQQQPDIYRLVGGTALTFTRAMPTTRQRLDGVSALLDLLAPTQQQVA